MMFLLGLSLGLFSAIALISYKDWRDHAEPPLWFYIKAMGAVVVFSAFLAWAGGQVQGYHRDGGLDNCEYK